jgi:YD repeat-containing protein
LGPKQKVGTLVPSLNARFAQFRTAATDANGHIAGCGNYDAHRVPRLEHPNGINFRVRYDREGHRVETWSERQCRSLKSFHA